MIVSSTLSYAKGLFSGVLKQMSHGAIIGAASVIAANLCLYRTEALQHISPMIAYMSIVFAIIFGILNLLLNALSPPKSHQAKDVLP